MSQNIYIMNSDKIKLLEVIDKAAYHMDRTDTNIKALEAEINKAIVLQQDSLKDPFIKMNTRAVIAIDQEEEEITLVYPQEANIKHNKISVLSPIGTAILGYCEGSSVEWKVPSGNVHIRIHKILHE